MTPADYSQASDQGAASNRDGRVNDVRLWHKADVPLALTNVCFEGYNGHEADMTRCPLMTKADIDVSSRDQAC